MNKTGSYVRSHMKPDLISIFLLMSQFGDRLASWVGLGGQSPQLRDAAKLAAKHNTGALFFTHGKRCGSAFTQAGW